MIFCSGFVPSFRRTALFPNTTQSSPTMITRAIAQIALLAVLLPAL